MTSESYIERTACAHLRGEGCICVKQDSEAGLPDRIVIYRPGVHTWIEFKNEVGRLRPAQKIMIDRLQTYGETVCIARSVEEARAHIRGLLLASKLGAR